jgi:hypothetical protein
MNDYAKIFTNNFESWVLGFLKRAFDYIFTIKGVINQNNDQNNNINNNSLLGPEPKENEDPQLLTKHYVILFFMDLL